MPTKNTDEKDREYADREVRESVERAMEKAEKGGLISSDERKAVSDAMRNGPVTGREKGRGGDDSRQIEGNYFGVRIPGPKAIPNNPASDVPYGAAEAGMSQLTESMPPEVEAARARSRAAQQSAEDQTQWGLGDLGSVLANPGLGIAKAGVKFGMQKARGQKAYNDEMNKAGFSELRGTPGERPERDGGKDLLGQPPTPGAPVRPEPEAPVTPTLEPPDPNDPAFTTKARKRKSYLSTILGGGVPAGTPQGKTLMGA